jgi:hypothetical protein
MTPSSTIEALLDGIVKCPSADALVYPARRRDAWRQPGAGRGFPEALASTLIVVGPGVRLGGQLGEADAEVVDFSGTAGRGYIDPKRRTLEEGWFTLARQATEIALASIAHDLPTGLGEQVKRHSAALSLRLKTDIALRLRRLEVVEAALEHSSGPVLLIEGDQPLDDLEIAARLRGRPVSRLFADCASDARRRQRRRGEAGGEPGPGVEALEAVIRRWRPSLRGLRPGVMVAADLRSLGDFRHAATAEAILDDLHRREHPQPAILLQPYTRLTHNVFRAWRRARRNGASMHLLRQPRSGGLHPRLAPLRTLLLQAVATRLGEDLHPARRAAILEATGGFIAASLGPLLALIQAFEAHCSRHSGCAVIAVPVGAPFGGALVSAARAVQAPSIEVQTLMIGASERDPAPIAEKLAVLDTEQRRIFATRFGVAEDRFVLAGRVGQDAWDGDVMQAADNSDVLFASQPLDGICIAAVELLAPACEARGVRLDIAPHPDETEQEIEAYRRVLSRFSGGRGRVLPRGSATRAIPDYGVLATVVSNMAMWAAARGRDVMTVDVGVALPLDFAEMGVAVKASSVDEAVAVLEDLRARGPISEGLSRSRTAFFARNPQLQGGDAARIIVDSVLSLADGGAAG